MKKDTRKTTDLYEFTMTCANLLEGRDKEIQYYDLFYRRNVNDTGYAVMAGLSDIIEWLQNYRFDEDEISYLRSLNIFPEKYLEYLKDFKFTGDVFAIPDGTVIFPNEPLITIRANAIEAKLIETDLLNYINHQSLIATRARRAKEAMGGKKLLEFGARRAHGKNAAINGAKAAYIGGADGTSCFGTGFQYGVPITGTMAHSWVTEHESEYQAFLTYAKFFPNNSVFLVDTYDTLKSGVPNAIRVAKDYLIPNGYNLKGIRLDSGDFSYLSKEARRMLDEEGLTDVKISASDDLIEGKIAELEKEGAAIDTYAMGTKLITSSEDASFGGVYKLVAVEKDGEIIPKMKVSDTAAKTINPGYKKVYRFYDKDTNYALADVITLADEEIPEDEYFIFKEDDPDINQVLTNYYVRELQVPVMKDGEVIYDVPNVHESKEHCNREMETIYEEIKRRNNPHIHYVDLSKNLFDLKNTMRKSFIEDVKGVSKTKEKV